MNGWRAAVSVAAALALLATGCTRQRDEFQSRSFDDIENALVAEGLQVCDVTPTDGHANQAVDGRQYRVGVDCEADDETTVVVDEFTSAADRDAAARNFEVQVRPPASGVVWTYGPFTIHLSGEREDEAEDRVTAALDGLGAE